MAIYGHCAESQSAFSVLCICIAMWFGVRSFTLQVGRVWCNSPFSFGKCVAEDRCNAVFRLLEPLLFSVFLHSRLFLVPLPFKRCAIRTLKDRMIANGNTIHSDVVIT